MGSWCGLYFGDEEVLSSKSEPIYTDLFRSEDKIICEESDGETIREVYKYVTSVQIAIERLRAKGATLEAAQQLFEEYKSDVIRSLEYKLSDQNFYDKIKVLNGIAIATVIDFSKWTELVQRYFDGEMPTDMEHFAPRVYIESEIDYLFLGSSDYSNYGLSKLNNDAFLGILSAFKDKENTEITFEYSELVHSGYVEPDADLAADTLRSKTVILTEGVSDKRFIDTAFKLLKPHLVDCYSFLEFEEHKLPGSASALVQTIKALSAAGIENDIVAVFDNDTAARDALTALKQVKVRKNIRIVNLPYVDLLSHYPTIGPQGQTFMNVNGLAGSIELYFPTEALKGSGGQYHPVMWKGYIENQQQYQGEVSRKLEIQKNFEVIAESIERGEKTTNDFDFKNMRKVLETICGFSFSES